MPTIKRSESAEVFDRVLRGEASSTEYVEAVRREAREAVADLMNPARRDPPDTFDGDCPHGCSPERRRHHEPTA